MRSSTGRFPPTAPTAWISTMPQTFCMWRVTADHWSKFLFGPDKRSALAGVPDATFFNPTSGLVHVAIEDPGLIQTVDPLTGSSTQFITAKGAKTTALVEPDRLYVFSPLHKGILDLRGAKENALLDARWVLSQPRHYWRRMTCQTIRSVSRTPRSAPRPKVGRPPSPVKGIQNGRSKAMKPHRQSRRCSSNPAEPPIRYF